MYIQVKTLFQQNCRIDKMYGMKLETNECEENESRCHNGMCIPERFLNDSVYNSAECLDRTDEHGQQDKQFLNEKYITCAQDPSFRCAEATYPINDLNFSCGDGQHINRFVASITVNGTEL